MPTITIQGYEFPVHPRYKAGHVLNEPEAEALNQALWDNLRNNFTNKIKKTMESDGGGLSKASQEDLIRQFEAYSKEYQFGQRRTPADPIHAQVQAQAISLARVAIRDAMRQQGQKDAYSAEEIEAAAHELVQADSSFTEKAQRIVEERRANAEAALRSLLDRPGDQNRTAPDNPGQQISDHVIYSSPSAG